VLKVKTLPFDGTTDGTDPSDQQDEIGPEIRLLFRATFAPLKSVLSGKSVVYSVFVFSLSKVEVEETCRKCYAHLSDAGRRDVASRRFPGARAAIAGNVSLQTTI